MVSLCRRYRFTLVLLLVSLALAVPAAAETPEKAPPHKTDFLYEGRWGLMYHYCSSWKPAEARENWSRTIDGFDAKGLAKQLKELGVGHFLITAKHCGLPIAPNAAYEKLNPGKAPKRDLIMDLADELAKHDINLMCYLATGMGIERPKAAQATAAILEEWSKRYGTKVRGWWLDNNCGDKELQKLIADAARAGNPDALVAFSPPKGQVRNSEHEDYTAGNTHAPGHARCQTRFVQGVQWHMLTYLGYNWAGYCKHRGRPRYDVAKAGGITKACVSGGGVVTWDVPHLLNGLVHPDCMGVLKGIGEHVRAAKRETRASRGLPPKFDRKPHKTDWLYDARWGIFYRYRSPSSRDPETAWEKKVRSFDVPALVKQLKNVGAGYFMISARHSASLPLAPASDHKGGKFPSRDLVAEIADALAKEKIPLLLHVFDGKPALVTELSKRYGKKVRGWWLDGPLPDEKGQKAVADACRSGNPDALVAFCGGIPYQRYSRYEDYTGGYTSRAGGLTPIGRFTKGLQYHGLGTFGFSKYQRPYYADKAAEITGKVVLGGGVMTWNTPHDATGKIAKEWLPSVVAAGKAARRMVRDEAAVHADNKVPEAAKLPPPPAEAITTTLKHVDARSISAKMDWWPERQVELGLVTCVGQVHAHFIRALLRFDLEGVDRARPLHSARLYLHANLGPIGSPKEQCNQFTVNRLLSRVQKRDNRWYVYNIAGEGGQLVTVTKVGLYEIDVTEIVKAWLSGAENCGFRLSAPGLGGAWQRYSVTWRSYNSKPYDPEKNPKGPRLVLHQLPKKGEDPAAVRAAMKAAEEKKKRDAEARAAAAAAGKRPSGRVLILGVDGAMVAAVRKSKTPNLDALAAGGAASWDAFAGGVLGTPSRQNTASIASWNSILRGVWANKHKGARMMKGHPLPADDKNYPCFFARVKAAFPGARCASIVNWDPINTYMIPKDHFKAKGKDDAEVAALAAKHLKEKDPDALFIQLDEVDHAGHGHDYVPSSPKYVAAIEEADKRIGEIVSALKGRKGYAKENWLILAVTDHGGRNKTHGGDSPEERTVFLIAHGAAAKKGVVSPGPGITAVAVTALKHMGVEIKKEWKLDAEPFGLK